MSLPTFLRNVTNSRTSRRPKRRPHVFSRSRSFEQLEDRLLLAADIVPNDARFHQQWGLEVTEAPAAWAVTTGSTQVTVAVNDSGVDYTHPDLYLNIWINQDEIPHEIRKQLQDVDADGLITFWDLNDPSGVNIGTGKITDLNGTGYIDGGDLIRTVAAGGWADGKDDRPNGYVDDLIGWDFDANDNDPMDTIGHGTSVAGIIGATANNEIGIAGVNWKTQIMPLARRESLQATIDAVYYAVDNGAQISNHSYSATPSIFSEAELAAGRAAFEYAEANGHLVVASAGNQKQDADLFPRLPAAFDLENVISVAATTNNESLAEFSNFGTVSVDLGAPGKNTWSTWLAGTYDNFGGTSSAAPHVAGAAALILSVNPNLGHAQVKSLILDNVDPVAELQGITVSGGRLNIFQAVSAATLTLAVDASATDAGAASQSVGQDLVSPFVSESLAGGPIFVDDSVTFSRLQNDAVDPASRLESNLGLRAAANMAWALDHAIALEENGADAFFEAVARGANDGASSDDGGAVLNAIELNALVQVFAGDVDLFDDGCGC